MTSLINSLYINIDEAYPVAGVDNDTQGFRDNFDIIKSSLAVASSEITVLQDTTAKTNAGNNFAGNTVTNTTLVTSTEKSFSPGVFSSDGVVQFRNGGHQRIILDVDDLNIVIDWDITGSEGLADNRYGKIIVEISALAAEDAFNVGWSTSGGGTLKYSNDYPNNFKVTVVPKLIEFTTYDGGGSMFIRYLGEFTEVENELAIENYDSLREDLNSGTISLTAKTTVFAPTVLATSTLTAGVEGQVKVLIMKSNTGEMTVNVAAPGWKASGGGAISLTTIGQSCTLQYTDSKWYCIGNNGSVFA
jgi:hypothetical protein